MPPIATFEAVDPFAPQKPATPVVELTALGPGEPDTNTLAWQGRLVRTGENLPQHVRCCRVPTRRAK